MKVGEYSNASYRVKGIRRDRKAPIPPQRGVGAVEYGRRTQAVFALAEAL
jgi:hypothetical protein